MFIFNNLETLLILLLLALTTCEVIVQKDISKSLRNQGQALESKTHNPLLKTLIREFFKCPTCHTTISYFCIGSLTSLLTLNWPLFIAVLITAVPAGLIAYIIYK